MRAFSVPAGFALDLNRNPSREGTPLVPWLRPAEHVLEIPPTIALNRSLNIRYPVPEVGEVLTYVEGGSELTLEEEERLYKNILRRLKDHDMPDSVLVEYQRLYQQKNRLKFFAKQEADRTNNYSAAQMEVAKLTVSISHSVGVHEKEVYDLQKHIQYLDCLDRSLGRSFYHEEEVSRRANRRAAEQQQRAQEAARRKADAARQEAIEAAHKAAEAAIKQAEAEAACKKAADIAAWKAAKKEAARQAKAAKKQQLHMTCQQAKKESQRKAEAGRLEAERSPLIPTATREGKERAWQWDLESQQQQQRMQQESQQQHDEQQNLHVQLLRDAVLQEELGSGAVGLETLQHRMKQKQTILSCVPVEPFKRAAWLGTAVTAAAPAASRSNETVIPPNTYQLPPQEEQQQQQDQQGEVQEQPERQHRLQGLSRSALLKLRDCGEEVRQRLASGRLSAKRLLTRAMPVDLVERLDSTSFDQVVQQYWSP
jgi:hypothetical protein